LCINLYAHINSTGVSPKLPPPHLECLPQVR
jgi:hypothetical protein